MHDGHRLYRILIQSDQDLQYYGGRQSDVYGLVRIRDHAVLGIGICLFLKCLSETSETDRTDGYPALCSGDHHSDCGCRLHQQDQRRFTDHPDQCVKTIHSAGKVHADGTYRLGCHLDHSDRFDPGYRQGFE